MENTLDGGATRPGSLQHGTLAYALHAPEVIAAETRLLSHTPQGAPL